MKLSGTPSTGRNGRFVFYAHDGLGLGHTRRNLAIAAALVELCPQASILVASSTDDAHRLGLPPRVELLRLPGLRKTANDEYHSRRLPVQREEIRHLRASLLEATIKSFRPDVVLVDKHPFGARGEFRAGLAALKEYGGRSVLGLRDILDEPATVRQEWAEYGLQERIAEFHDRVFVYGERAVLDPVAEYDLPPSLGRRTSFCGYVVNRDDEAHPEPRPVEFSRDGRRRPVVLATTGGGEDGFALLLNFIEVAARASWQGVAIAGPMTPAHELSLLRGKAIAAGVLLHTFIPRLPVLFGSIDALVCMGGYNTLTEAASQAVPTVCIPRVVPRTEQLIRARAFERLGLLALLHPDDLNPDSLSTAVGAALDRPRAEIRAHVEATLSFDGARRAAQELLALACLEAGAPEAIASATY